MIGQDYALKSPPASAFKIAKIASVLWMVRMGLISILGHQTCPSDLLCHYRYPRVVQGLHTSSPQKARVQANIEAYSGMAV